MDCWYEWQEVTWLSLALNTYRLTCCLLKQGFQGHAFMLVQLWKYWTCDYQHLKPEEKSPLSINHNWEVTCIFPLFAMFTMCAVMNIGLQVGEISSASCQQATYRGQVWWQISTELLHVKNHPPQLTSTWIDFLLLHNYFTQSFHHYVQLFSCAWCSQVGWDCAVL